MRSLLRLLPLLLTPPTPQHPLADLVGATVEAQVTRVSDGDTIDVIPAGEKRAIRVRVFGIDTPERGEPFATRARNHTRVLAFGKTVRVTGESVDRYGRLVARIRIGDVDLGADLLREGLACHYTRYSDDRTYAKAQADARATSAGFWAADAGKPRCATRSKRPRALPAT